MRVKADQRRVSAGRDPRSDVRVQDRVERFVDGGEPIASDSRLTPQRDVVLRGRRRPQERLLSVLKCSSGRRYVRLCRRKP